jgi:hypothetical protein
MLENGRLCSCIITFLPSSSLPLRLRPARARAILSHDPMHGRNGKSDGGRRRRTGVTIAPSPKCFQGAPSS